MDEVTGQMRAHDGCVSCGPASEEAVASVAERLGRGIKKELACFVLDMRQTGGSRTGCHPFLLHICCVNSVAGAFSGLGFRKYAAKFE